MAKSNQKKQAATATTPIKNGVNELTSTEIRSHFTLEHFSSKTILGILVGLFCLITLALFWNFLIQKFPYLFIDIGIDSTIIIYPNLVHLAEYWQQFGLPSWTFGEGLGKNIYPFWFDPFTNFLYFFSPRGIASGLIYVAVAEILATALCFYAFLKEAKSSQFASIIGAISFAFCGYMILCGAWDINRYATEVLYAALLLWLLERFIQRQEWTWLPIPYALIAIQNPFNLYLYGLLTLVVLFIRNPHFFKNINRNFTPIVWAGIIGLGLSAFILFSNIIQIIDSPRGSGEYTYSGILMAHQLFKIAPSTEFSSLFNRLFSPNLNGYADQFLGWQNYMEAPIFYCGLLSIIVFPQAFKFLPKKQAIVYGLTWVILILICIFPFLRFTFWLFTGDYYRSISLFVVILLLYGSTQALTAIDKLSKINIPILIGTLLFALILLFFPYTIKAPSAQGFRPIAACLLILYTGLLWLFKNPQFRGVSQILLVIALVSEIIFFQHPTINKRKIASFDLLFSFGAEKGYNDGVKEAQAYIKQRDKSLFFRTEKDFSSVSFTQSAYLGSTNDSKVQGYYGSKCYGSFNHGNYIKLLTSLGLIDPKDELASRFIFKGLALDPIAGGGVSNIKYLLTRSNRDKDFIPLGYEPFGKTPEMWIYRYKYGLPFGTAYSTYIKREEFNQLDNTRKQLAFLRGVVLDAEQEDAIKSMSATMPDTAALVTLGVIESYSNALKKDTLQLQSFTPKQIKGSIKVPSNRVLFFSIPFDRGWHGLLNGEEVPLQKVNIGFTGMMLPAGKHQVELYYEPPFVKLGMAISLFTLLLYGGFRYYEKIKKRKLTYSE